jgi:hypothetical protein
METNNNNKSVCVFITNLYTKEEWIHTFTYEDDENLKIKIKEYISAENNIAIDVIKLTLNKKENKYSAFFSYYLR